MADPLDRPDLEDIDYQEEYDRPGSLDPSDRQAASHTAFIMEGAKLHGVSPGQDDYDTRDIYEYDAAADGIEEIVDILATRVAPDGSPIATDRTELLWGMVHALESQSRNLQYRIDRDIKEHEDLRYTEGISEVNDEALSKVLNRLVNYTDRAEAFTRLRKIAASRYRHHTGEVWRSRRRTDTAAASPRIDMRDFKKSREWRNQHDGIRIARHRKPGSASAPRLYGRPSTPFARPTAANSSSSMADTKSESMRSPRNGPASTTSARPSIDPISRTLPRISPLRAVTDRW